MFVNFLIALLQILLLADCQKVILLSSSIGYYNIRQVNNIVKTYQNLLRNGFEHKDILLMISEVQTCCEKNKKIGTLSFQDGDYTNIFKNIEIDYYQSQITMSSVTEIIMGYYSPYVLNKKKVQIQVSEKENLFVYITGHGGDTYFKIRQREAIIDEQFTHVFKTAQNKKEFSSSVIISDSCSAITPFEKVEADNFLAMGSSSFGQKSYSYGYDIELNQPKSDDFSYYFNEILSSKAIIKGVTSSIQSITFKDLHTFMDKQKLKVNSKIVSNKIKNYQLISSYVTKKSNPIKFVKSQTDQTFMNLFFNS